MLDYGQFCTVARGAEVLCDRWTPLVVRELLCGSTQFNEIRRGVPRMSPTLLAKRLRTLERARTELGLREGVARYLGAELLLVPQRGRSRVTRAGDRLLVPAAEPRPALERWYRRRARTEVAPRLDAACAAAGTDYSKLTIRGQRTRWASCAASGAMSFNWRLLLAPAPVLDSVVWHEVCHLEVPDHSARFWALLRERCPDYDEHHRWLRRYGPTLVL